MCHQCYGFCTCVKIELRQCKSMLRFDPDIKTCLSKSDWDIGSASAIYSVLILGHTDPWSAQGGLQ